MGHDLNDRTIAFLVADEGVEQVELTEPWQAVEQAAGSPSSLVHLRPERHLDGTGGEVVSTQHRGLAVCWARSRFEASSQLRERLVDRIWLVHVPVAAGATIHESESAKLSVKPGR